MLLTKLVIEKLLEDEVGSQAPRELIATHAAAWRERAGVLC